MLKMDSVSVHYGNSKILSDISFSVKEGERLCILGPNGSGKTTLLLAATNLIPYKGKITLCGEDLRNLSRKNIARKTALMSQITEVSFPYTVYETVLMGRYAASKGTFSINTKNDKLLTKLAMEKTGILDLKDRQITTLSGGQLQRVFLARTFAQDPDIILLDEPTNHLDLKYKIDLIEHLIEWSKEKNKAVIGVLHDINLALSFATKILLLDKGKIVAYDLTDKFPKEELSDVFKVDIPTYMNNVLKYWK